MLAFNSYRKGISSGTEERSRPITVITIIEYLPMLQKGTGINRKAANIRKKREEKRSI